MADKSFTEANVIVPSTASTEVGFAGEALACMDVVKKDTDGRWIKAADDVLETDTVAVVVSGGVVENQPVVLARYENTEITVGSVLTQKEVLVISAANAGKIAPLADLGGSDSMFIVGVAKSATVLRLMLKFTGA